MYQLAEEGIDEGAEEGADEGDEEGDEEGAAEGIDDGIVEGAGVHVEVSKSRPVAVYVAPSSLAVSHCLDLNPSLINNHRKALPVNPFPSEP